MKFSSAILSLALLATSALGAPTNQKRCRSKVSASASSSAVGLMGSGSSLTGLSVSMVGVAGQGTARSPLRWLFLSTEHEAGKASAPARCRRLRQISNERALRYEPWAVVFVRLYLAVIRTAHVQRPGNALRPLA